MSGFVACIIIDINYIWIESAIVGHWFKVRLFLFDVLITVLWSSIREMVDKKRNSLFAVVHQCLWSNIFEFLNSKLKLGLHPSSCSLWVEACTHVRVQGHAVIFIQSILQAWVLIFVFIWTFSSTMLPRSRQSILIATLFYVYLQMPHS